MQNLCAGRAAGSQASRPLEDGMPAAYREAVATQMLRGAWLAAQPSACKLFLAKPTIANEDGGLPIEIRRGGCQNSKSKGAGPVA